MTLFIVVTTILIALPRFARQAPDSHHYLNLAGYFQGQVPFEYLCAPFAYRPLLPFLASLGPTNRLEYNFALLNILSTIAAFLVLYRFFHFILGDELESFFGSCLLLFSFPTYNYSSRVITDPAALFFFVAAILALARIRFALFCFLACFGVLTREANLSLVMILWFMLLFDFNSSWKSKILKGFYGIPPIFIYLLVKRLLIDLPQYSRPLSIDRLWSNLNEPVAWATFLLTLVSPILLLGVGLLLGKGHAFREWSLLSGPKKRLLVAVTLTCCILIGYSMFTAFMSGRFVWPLYTSLIPLVMISLRKTFIGKWLYSIQVQEKRKNSNSSI